jgi:hypothetical protein
VEVSDAFVDALSKLWGQATGGGNVAAQPGTATHWPTAARPAGLEEALAWFRGGFERSRFPRFLFLVGGPGAGKSHAAAHVVAGLSEIAPFEDGLAHRTYQYETVSRPLTVVNDATIKDRSHLRGALARDLAAAVDGDTHFFACINRGILIEEMADLNSPEPEPDSPERALVNWLLHDGSTAVRTADSQWRVADGQQTAYIRAGDLFHTDSQVAQILVVFVDVCSLFEKSPNCSIQQLAEESAAVFGDTYRVERFRDRPNLQPAALPAGQLFESVVTSIRSSMPALDPDYLDPFRANLQSLDSGKVLSGLLSVLRASEIVSSQRMTYREVWGALSRAIVGDLPAQRSGSELKDFILSSQPTGDDPVARFEQITQLASIRFSQAIFGADASHILPDQLLRDPITRLTHLVDPVRDALPGSNVQGTGGWATPISDAFAGQVGDASPLDALLYGIDEGDPFRQAVTDFDRSIDDAFRTASDAPGLTPHKRYEFIVWYGGYLMRLYATSNGIPAFRGEIETWTSAWALSPKIPGALESQLMTLLKPARVQGASDGASLIPIFDSRTNPITGDSRPLLALRTNHIEMVTSRLSESLFLHLKEGTKEIRPVLLDFPLVREAMACGEGYPGVTELSGITSPRLERFRAARLVPGKHMDTQRYRVVSGLSDEVLSVEEDS